MVLLYSEKTKLGLTAPLFDLEGVDGKRYTLSCFQSQKVLVVMFICNHCPYVKAIEDRILALTRSYQGKSVQFVGICSNDSKDYPDDSPSNLKKRWLEKAYSFPYLIDSTQDVARQYGAVCTPEFYVFNESRELVYHGQFDDNWKSPEAVTKESLREAVDLTLKGVKPSADQISSMGCSIKWKK